MKEEVRKCGKKERGRQEGRRVEMRCAFLSWGVTRRACVYVCESALGGNLI